jgi:hypothetical protein
LPALSALMLFVKGLAEIGLREVFQAFIVSAKKKTARQGASPLPLPWSPSSPLRFSICWAVVGYSIEFSSFNLSKSPHNGYRCFEVINKGRPSLELTMVLSRSRLFLLTVAAVSGVTLIACQQRAIAQSPAARLSATALADETQEARSVVLLRVRCGPRR